MKSNRLLKIEKYLIRQIKSPYFIKKICKSHSCLLVSIFRFNLKKF